MERYILDKKGGRKKKLTKRQAEKRKLESDAELLKPRKKHYGQTAVLKSLLIEKGVFTEQDFINHKEAMENA
jgi:hypothetical protein